MFFKISIPIASTPEITRTKKFNIQLKAKWLFETISKSVEKLFRIDIKITVIIKEIKLAVETIFFPRSSLPSLLK